MKNIIAILLAFITSNISIAADLPPEINSISYAPHFSNTVMYGDTVMITGYNLCPGSCTDYSNLSISMSSSYGDLNASIVYANNNTVVFNVPIMTTGGAVTYTTPFGSTTSTSFIEVATFSFTPREAKVGDYIYIFTPYQFCDYSDGTCGAIAFIGGGAPTKQIQTIAQTPNLLVGIISSGAVTGLVTVVTEGGGFWQSISNMTIHE